SRRDRDGGRALVPRAGRASTVPELGHPHRRRRAQHAGVPPRAAFPRGHPRDHAHLLQLPRRWSARRARPKAEGRLVQNALEQIPDAVLNATRGADGGTDAEHDDLALVLPALREPLQHRERFGPRFAGKTAFDELGARGAPAVEAGILERAFLEARPLRAGLAEVGAVELARGEDASRPRCEQRGEALAELETTEVTGHEVRYGELEPVEFGLAKVDVGQA